MDFISLAQYDSPAFTQNDFDDYECDDCGHLGHTSCSGEGWDDYGDPDNIFGY